VTRCDLSAGWLPLTPLFIDLDLGGEFTRLTVLDAVGELLEEGNLRSTEAGVGQWFAALPPSIIGTRSDAPLRSRLRMNAAEQPVERFAAA
jgi:hypothetical protein